MSWLVRERRGVNWNRQSAAAAPSPLPLLVFFGLFMMLLFFETYSEFTEKMERRKMGFKFGLLLLPVVGVAAVNLIMLQRRWLRYAYGVSAPVYQAAAGEGGQPWGLLVVVGVLLVMVHYQSSFQSWFRSF